MMCDFTAVKLFVAIPLLLFSALAMVAEDDEDSSGSFFFEGSPRPPLLKSAMPERRQTVPTPSPEVHWRYLNNRPVKVSRFHITPYARAVRLEGLNLGKLDRSIEPNDLTAVEAEVRRYFGMLADFVGDISAFELGDFQVSSLDGLGRDSQEFVVRFRQFANDVILGSGSLRVKGDTVFLASIFLVEPHQPNLHRERWASLELVRAEAERTILHELDLDHLVPERLSGPRLALKPIDEQGTHAPFYRYSYWGYEVQVNALTLESTIWNEKGH